MKEKEELCAPGATPPNSSPPSSSASRPVATTVSSTGAPSKKRLYERSHTPSTSHRRTPKRVQETDNVLHEVIVTMRALSSTQEISDACSDFGNVVADSMRQMSEEQQIFAQKHITDILFLGRLGKLSSSTKIVE